MAAGFDSKTLTVVKFAQELLGEESDKPITAALIAAKIDEVVAMRPAWGAGLDRQAAIDELIRRFSMWIGQDTTLQSSAGHEPWLTAARRRDWRYWQRYREWLERDLSPTAVDALDRSTDHILGLLEDPTRGGTWDRRGLVVGHVQSGKTGNYTGLICKAADAGYKIIIVLAGLHNNLRSQTQIRLDEGFLGYETEPILQNLKVVGVGTIDADPQIRPNYATNRSDAGDFNTKVAQHLGITPEQRPWLFVVKKNKTVLERLYQWIRNHVTNSQDAETGRKIVTHLPLLLIDDEADHASVDTGEEVVDSDGNPDEDHQPTAINSRIRKILNSFSRAAYIGYTATPFANIFIHERGTTKEEGPDLFPSAFIVNLAAPSSYVGPTRVFGSSGSDGRRAGLPLVRKISDYTTTDGTGGWMPHKHKNGHRPIYDGSDTPPPSLVEAVDAFMIGCAVRRARGSGNSHMSMLVHVTRFNSVQSEVYRQVDDYVRQVRQRVARRIEFEPIRDRFQKLWERDFEPTTCAIREAGADETSPRELTWSEVETHLYDAIADIQVKMINGTAKDALDYANHRATGLKVIAIGGDKLARGLTLEGLCVSYFLRASKMYDTLMQMGRWFGYRPGYLDLCRLYTTPDLVEWFGHIADAADELREEFDIMAAHGATPREYGLRVQSHPVLMVTSRLKMRSARDLQVSFSGHVLETVSLFRDKDVLQRNLTAARNFLAGLGPPAESEPIRRSRGGGTTEWRGALWRSAHYSDVVSFLRSYKTHPEAHKVATESISEFVESMAAVGELTEWSVAVIGGGAGESYSLLPDLTVDMLQRRGNPDLRDRYAIGRLLSPRDETIDVDEAAWLAALTETRVAWHADATKTAGASEPDFPSGPAIRRVLGKGASGVAPQRQRGLLLLYLLDPKPEWTGLDPGMPPVVAIGLSLPESEAGVKVTYVVNNVDWEALFGGAD